jgi:bifunctional non-homologous end joining protein LigD
VRREKIYSKDTQRDIGYIIVNDLETLLYVINMGTIPLHLWSSRIDSLERPDWLVLDLDPKGAPFAHVVKVARALHEILTKLRLESFIKTSEPRLPSFPGAAHPRAGEKFCPAAGAPGTSHPDMDDRSAPRRRRLDRFRQNGYGVTIAAFFAVRPLPADGFVPSPGRGQRAAASSRFTITLYRCASEHAIPRRRFSQGNRSARLA